jgi:hypothetical protein
MYTCHSCNPTRQSGLRGVMGHDATSLLIGRKRS